ncbi:MAG: endolytic transglycosylase MltG, partial [Mycobacteriales bacterium]
MEKRLPKPVGLTVVGVVALALVAGLLVGARTVYNVAFGAPDYSGTGTGAVVVQVRSGDSARSVGETLVDEGVVKSVKAFTNAAKDTPDYRKLQPGFYELRLKMAAKTALGYLLDGKHRKRGRVTIPEGAPLAQVVDRLVKYTELQRDDVIAALGNPAVLGLPGYSGGKPEGFLFPATYDVEPGTGAVDALQLMTEKYSEVAGGLDLDNGAKAVGLTPYQVVILASIIEKETPQPGDRAKVARVVLNRLAKGMR